MRTLRKSPLAVLTLSRRRGNGVRGKFVIGDLGSCFGFGLCFLGVLGSVLGLGCAFLGCWVLFWATQVGWSATRGGGIFVFFLPGWILRGQSLRVILVLLF